MADVRRATLLCLAALGCGRTYLPGGAPGAGGDDASADATTDDAGNGDGACDLCPFDSGPLPDGPITCDAGPFVDAGCDDGSLPPGVGTPFACGAQTCWSGSQYCWFAMAGPAPPPNHYDMGVCRPFPCVCGAQPTCGCTPYACQPACQCTTDDAGAMLVTCSFP